MNRDIAHWTNKRIHFVGIGGAGMSGLARIALSHGISVSGSDAKDSSVVTGLRALGATVNVGHSASHVDGSDVVVFSSAIIETNPEISRAKELNLEILTRAQALATLMSSSKSIAVAGTHGKTTTSSMLTVALQACGLDPSFAIGGTLTSYEMWSYSVPFLSTVSSVIEPLVKSPRPSRRLKFLGSRVP